MNVSFFTYGRVTVWSGANGFRPRLMVVKMMLKLKNQKPPTELEHHPAAPGDKRRAEG